QCPATPGPASNQGCPYGDQDGDGVDDGSDQCPDTPAGATVDANGCPSDSDNDGVLDGIDQCPDQPGPAENQGCPTDIPDGDDDDDDDVVPTSPPGCDAFIQFPDGAVVGQFMTSTLVYWGPDADMLVEPLMTLEAGTTAWVLGMDASGGFYQILWQCGTLWVPVDSIGPNPDATWNGTALPTGVIG
ncbi:MAG: hypothetical protein GYB65_03135, partial [Chloroflexi bacterium]|nr:hypothetical protein [Chloroflexota bacterium]